MKRMILSALLIFNLSSFAEDFSVGDKVLVNNGGGSLKGVIEHINKDGYIKTSVTDFYINSDNVEKYVHVKSYTVSSFFGLGDSTIFKINDDVVKSVGSYHTVKILDLTSSGLVVTDDYPGYYMDIEYIDHK